MNNVLKNIKNPKTYLIPFFIMLIFLFIIFIIFLVQKKKDDLINVPNYIINVVNDYLNKTNNNFNIDNENYKFNTVSKYDIKDLDNKLWFNIQVSFHIAHGFNSLNNHKTKLNINIFNSNNKNITLNNVNNAFLKKNIHSYILKNYEIGKKPNFTSTSFSGDNSKNNSNIKYSDNSKENSKHILIGNKKDYTSIIFFNYYFLNTSTININSKTCIFETSFNPQTTGFFNNNIDSAIKINDIKSGMEGLTFTFDNSLANPTLTRYTGTLLENHFYIFFIKYNFIANNGFLSQYIVICGLQKNVGAIDLNDSSKLQINLSSIAEKN